MAEEGLVDISGLDKAELLAALFNGSKQLGMGVLDVRGRNQMTVEDAREELKWRQANAPKAPMLRDDAFYFDYVLGRVMKVNLAGDSMRTGLYNRDNGANAAERIISELRTRTKAGQLDTADPPHVHESV